MKEIYQFYIKCNDYKTIFQMQETKTESIHITRVYNPYKETWQQLNVFCNEQFKNSQGLILEWKCIQDLLEGKYGKYYKVYYNVYNDILVI